MFSSPSNFKTEEDFIMNPFGQRTTSLVTSFSGVKGNSLTINSPKACAKRVKKNQKTKRGLSYRKTSHFVPSHFVETLGKT